jgi:hypothetical protein
MTKDRAVASTRWLFVALTLCISTLLRAQVNLGTNDILRQQGLSFGAGVEYSDNVQRTPDAPIGEGVATLFSTVDLVRTGTRLDYNLLGNLQYADYFNNAYPRKVLGYFDGTADLAIVPHDFVWSVQDTLSQLNADPFATPTPNTVSTVNYFSTGPRLYLHFSPQTTMLLTGDYGKTSTNSASTVGAGNQSLDSNRYSGSVGLQQLISASTKLTVTAAVEHVDLIYQPAANYDRDLDTLMYETSWQRTKLTLSGGYVEIKSQGTNHGFGVGELTLARQISPTSTINLRVLQDVADALDLGRQDIRSLAGGPLDFRVVSAGPLRDRVVGLQWNYKRDRDGLQFQASWTQERSDYDPEFNREVAYSALQYRHTLRPGLILDLHGGYGRDHYQESQLTDREIDAGAALTFQPQQQYGLVLSIDRYDRDSTLLTARFHEDRAGLLFVYHVL